MSTNKYKFPDYILENREFLRKISKIRSKNQFSNLLTTANTDQILAITEIIHNILQGSVPLSIFKRIKLAKNADYYREIVKSKSKKKSNRKYPERWWNWASFNNFSSSAFYFIARYFKRALNN